MRTADVLNRIRDECPGFETVDHALTSNGDLPLPAALVTPSREAAVPNTYLGLHMQPMHTTFSVFILLRRRQDGVSDAGAADELDDLRGELLAALVNWSADPAFEPMNYAGGQLDRFHSGVACWRMDFTTKSALRT